MRTRLRAIWDSVVHRDRAERRVAAGDLTAEVVAAYMELLREQRRLQFDGQPIVNRLIFTTNRTGEDEEPVHVPDTFPEEWAE